MRSDVCWRLIIFIIDPSIFTQYYFEKVVCIFANIFADISKLNSHAKNARFYFQAGEGANGGDDGSNSDTGSENEDGEGGGGDGGRWGVSRGGSDGGGADRGPQCLTS